MLNGSIVALVTPLTERGETDFAALDGLVDFHLAHGTDGLVIAGTTGEASTLSRTEFSEMCGRVVNRVAGDVPVLAGTGSASTAKAIEQTIIAGGQGADGALVVTPYYNKPTQSGLEAHFTAIADSAEVPLLVYNVPSRTAVDLLPATVGRLSAHPGIMGIKEAVPDGARIEELCSRCGPSFTVLSGDDRSCLDAMRQGANGVISVAANVAPGLMHELCTAAAQLEWQEAEGINTALNSLFDVLMIETNPIPVKWALFEMGLISPHIRLPLTRLDEEFREPVRRCLIELGLIKA
jgi:4-hydroxy-tetrahydrodipicolinate synthase